MQFLDDIAAAGTITRTPPRRLFTAQAYELNGTILEAP